MVYKPESPYNFAFNEVSGDAFSRKLEKSGIAMIRVLLVVLIIGGLTAWIIKQNTGPVRPNETGGTLYQQEFDKARGVEDLLQEAAKHRGEPETPQDE